jgi:ATP-dependent exoDNAse (exonuclease V) beta subunit
MAEAPDDAAVRERARDIRHSIQLQAPAGSGKTTVLAQRFLAALAVADEPEEVLAITFTRKDAAEMRERVLAALEDALPPAQPERERWQSLRSAVQAQAARREWQLAELPQRLRIQTIDSLAAELARAMPVLGRMQTSLRVIDDAAWLYAEAARRTLREGEADPDYRADVDLLLERLDNNLDRAQRLLAALLPGRNRWQQLLLEHAPQELAGELQASLGRIVMTSLLGLRDTLSDAWRSEAAAIAREVARNRAEAGHEEGRWRAWLAADAGLGCEPHDLHCWQALAEILLLGAEDRLRSQVNVSNGFPKGSAIKARWQAWRDQLESRAEVLQLLAGMRALPAVLLDAQEQQAIAQRLLLT